MVLTQTIYRKSCASGRLCLYLGQRSFTDYSTHVDLVDGMVVIDETPLNGEKVFVQAVLTYRYGREEDEVMGISFAKELVVSSTQVYPLVHNREQLTPLQTGLSKKLGGNAHPFSLNLPPEAPASVTLQPGTDDRGKACGVEWELRAFIANAIEGPPQSKSLIRMIIRRHQYCTAKQGEQPVAVCTKDFLLSPGQMNLQVTLNKQIYYQGESISVDIRVTNQSNKQVKRLKISAVQLCDVSLGSSGQLRNIIYSMETQEGCPIYHGVSCHQTFIISPSVGENINKRGLAVDKIPHRSETCLAPSTLFVKPNETIKLGMVISYMVRVKLCMGPLGGELIAEVPYKLMHLPPSEEPPPLVVPQFNTQSSMEEEKYPASEDITTKKLMAKEVQQPAVT